MHTLSEENYLKVIYKLSDGGSERIVTGELAAALKINAASVTEKMQRLADKKLINYEKSKGVTLTKTGMSIAVRVLRKHRIWETFLVKYLAFGWEEVDEIAEQLEHIHSDKLIEKIDKLLGYPRFDPHGDPIPDSKGRFRKPCFKSLSELFENDFCRITGVKEDSEAFVTYFSKLGLSIGDTIEVKEIEKYNQSLLVKINRKKQIHIGNDVARNILITQNDKCCVFGEIDKTCPME